LGILQALSQPWFWHRSQALRRGTKALAAGAHAGRLVPQNAPRGHHEGSTPTISASGRGAGLRRKLMPCGRCSVIVPLRRAVQSMRPDIPASFGPWEIGVTLSWAASGTLKKSCGGHLHRDRSLAGGRVKSLSTGNAHGTQYTDPTWFPSYFSGRSHRIHIYKQSKISR
jgi:hypothetical protein